MSEFRKILVYANEFRSKHILSVFLILASVIMGMAPYLLVYHMLTKFVDEGEIFPEYIIFMSVGIAISIMMKNLFLEKGLTASHDVAYDTLMGMRKDFAKKMLRFPMGKIQEKGVGSYKKNFVDDVEQMELLLAHMIPEGLPYALSPFIVFIMLLILDYRLALLAAGSIPFGFFALVLMMRSGKKKMENYYRAEEKMNKTIVEYISGMEVIKIFNKTGSSFEKYSENVKGYRDYTLDWYKESWTYMAMYSAVLPCTILLLLPVGLYFYIQGSLPLNDFLFALMITMSIGTPLVKLVEFMPNFPNLKFRINELQRSFSGEEIKMEDRGLELSNFNIKYQNVTFSYDKKDVLEDVTFEVKENSVTAIVGESGSGKTTLAKLLVKFWDVKNGKITIGGIDISHMSMDKLMDLVSFVSQDTFLFDISIMENIRVGRPEASDMEVIEAAKLAQCHEFIEKLENGYDTMPGDSGNKLSGGERQRITIARAILKNSPIIILDEATSSTDPENEDKIQEAINSLIKSKTLIVIAHRLSTIIEANKIILMDKGKIIDEGTHGKLLEKSGKYQSLWKNHIEAVEWGLGSRNFEDYQEENYA